MTSQTGYLSIT